MSLRFLAETDLGHIIESDNGFGWDISITAPDGTIYDDLKGISNDIDQIIDPDTGIPVAGRNATVAIRTSSLIEVPEAQPDRNKKPWVIKFNDINGNLCVFKVVRRLPDRTLGLSMFLLEGYKE